MAGRGGETLVEGEERGVERFGEGDVHCVVGSDVLSELPDATEQLVSIPIPEHSIDMRFLSVRAGVPSVA